MNQKTKVGIIGSGPSGLLLSQLLYVNGIESIVVEKRTRAHVEGRIRAGILEQGMVDLLEAAQVADRLRKEALIHGGIALQFEGNAHRIDMEKLTGGKVVTVYGQNELTKDLMDAHEERGQSPVYQALDVQISGIEVDRPTLTYTKNGEAFRVECDYVIGCDGYHGVSRSYIPSTILKTYQKIYPFGWLGVLADVPPVSDELIYNNHVDGFALASQRSKTRSRYYIQCDLDEDIKEWPDDRFWSELVHRFGEEVGSQIITGPSIEKSIAPLRSFVAEPMRYKSLFLAGDSAHIVPPAGAKGLNLAASDIKYLSDALIRRYKTGKVDLLESYSDKALSRVWKSIRFSWWFTSLTHRFPEHEKGDLGHKLQIAELDYIVNSKAASTSFAENYVGLPY
ncbi:MAG: 4-hydroxybenzoate 3-monooxygenase [Verrucomicrobia bacterium]|nr:4-hydroxybenzoate 3-monooxygenase [Verrucomicrobiota bacterium]